MNPRLLAAAVLFGACVGGFLTGSIAVQVGGIAGLVAVAGAIFVADRHARRMQSDLGGYDDRRGGAVTGRGGGR